MALPAITIDDCDLEVVEQFTYLGSTVSDNLSFDTEIDRRIGKAATTLTRLTSRVWTNPKLTVKTKMVVYNACVVSTLVYGSETWTTYVRQEKRLNSFHLRSIRRILGISWQDSVQHRGPVLSQPSKHVHPTQTAQAALAGACLPHGGWPHPKRHSPWRVGIWKEIQRPPRAVVQGCLQERHESTWHQHRVLGGPCSRPHDMEKRSEQDRRKEAGECRSTKKGLNKGAQQFQQTRDHTQTRLLRQRLFLPHRSLHQQATLQQSNRQDNQNLNVLPWSNLIDGSHIYIIPAADRTVTRRAICLIISYCGSLINQAITCWRMKSQRLKFNCGCANSVRVIWR